MAWESIALVKNDLNEYRFCYIPEFANFYSGGVGGSDTTIRIGGLRNSNDDPGSAAFQLGKSYVSAIAAQDGIFNVMDDPTSGCDDFIYGTVGGEAIRLLETTGQSTWFWNFDFKPHKLTNNMQSDVQLLNFTGNVLKDQSKNEDTVWTWGLAYNAEDEQCYLMVITSSLYWNYAIGSPNWYDNAEVVITVCDSNLTDNNLYSVLKDSIPGGGGGGEPYIGGGTSTSGGGENATFDLTSDNINIPSLPSISASGAGLLTLYQVSLQNMHDFASYLWSPLFNVDTLKKLFNDPMDAIISLGMLPFTPTGGSTSNIFIGESDSGVSALRLVSQYYELDMGSLTLDTFYDSALDLNPYTKVDLYLPYCGTVSINPDEFDGKSIHVVYHVDILTGACVVFVEDGSRVLVQSQGNILTAIPFTSKDFKSIFGAVLGDAAAAGAALFALPTGGISAAAAVGIVGGAAMNSVNSKLNMPHGGQCASTAGFLSVQKPYLIITRPAQCLPEDNAAYQGYPAYITETVGNLSGFIKISEAHFDGFTCTDGELKEIDRLLKEGVYVQ